MKNYKCLSECITLSLLLSLSFSVLVRFRTPQAKQKINVPVFYFSYSEGERLTIELGRALREGEHKCKVYHMKLSEINDSSEPLTFLCDWILCSGATVEKTKRELLAQIASNEQRIEIPYNRCRLRRKCGSAPGKIFFDNQVFGDDIVLISNYEVN